MANRVNHKGHTYERIIGKSQATMLDTYALKQNEFKTNKQN